MPSWSRRLPAWGAVLLLLATAGAEAQAGPLDAFNRTNRRLNFWLLDHVIEPFARGYNWVVPKWGQERLRNVFHNLERPRDVVNSLLQAKPRRAAVHLGALVIDSTAGVAGAFHLSERWLGVEPPESTQETLGVYRIPAGAYLVLPVYGETCLRCLIGAVGDGVLHPLFWVTRETDSGDRTAIGAGFRAWMGVNTLARLMPPPRADRVEWEAYEARLRERPSYEEARELFFENLELDVAE